jgi:hypothetical protein
VILHQLVGLQHVGADLAAPGDILLVVVNFLEFFVLLLLLALMQPRLEHLHGQLLVAVLGFFLLALDRDTGRQMRDAHGAAGLVDVLAAGAAGTENIDPQVLIFNDHYDFVVELGIDEDRRKRCVPFAAGVKRGNPHQAMNTALGLHVSIGVLTRGGEGGALDAGFFTGLEVDQFQLEALALNPAGVHAEEYLRPVLGLGAAGPGIDGDDGILAVVLAVQHQLEGKALRPLVQILRLAAEVGKSSRVVFRNGHLQEPLILFQLSCQLLEALHPVADGRALLKGDFGLVRLVPETFLGDEGFELR